MCQFFSCITKGDGKLLYIGPKEREIVYQGGSLPCKTGQPIGSRDCIDSHSAIANYFGVDVDKVNKYEFRPLDRKFIVDQINTVNSKGYDDRDKANSYEFTTYLTEEGIQAMYWWIIVNLKVKKTK